MTALAFRDMRPGDAEAARRVAGGDGWNPRPGLWGKYLQEQALGVRECLVGEAGGRIVAYGTLVWFPRYAPFLRDGVPEIQDIAVAAPARGKGMGTALVAAFEARARAAGRGVMGIGVGLHAGYGAAQRLYVGLGYRPDGLGVTDGYRPVPPGRRVRVGDDLVLWMTRALA